MPSPQKLHSIVQCTNFLQPRFALFSFRPLISDNPFPEQVLGTLEQLPGCNPVQSNPEEAKMRHLCSFTKVFKGLSRAVSGSGYLTYTKTDHYSASRCASRCIKDPADCVFFNVYEENHPDGRSFVCTLWSQNKTAADATNYPNSTSLNITNSEGYVLGTTASRRLKW